MVTLRQLQVIENDVKVIRKGNLACPGCQLNLSMRHALAALEKKAIVVVPACCTSVIQGLGDGYGLNVPIFNCAFASAASVASGIARMMKRRDPDVTVVCWAGDGGTADIGLATVSGAAERDEDIIYIMYDNEGYQNTGAQKSGSTPRGAKTTTTVTGKPRRKKSVAKMMIANDVSYVATATAAYPQDLFDKVARAATEFRGHFRFIQIFSGCPPGWDADSRYMVELGKLAVSTGYWSLYEYANGIFTLSKNSQRYRDPSRRKPIEEYLKLQGRFRNMTPELIEGLKKDIEDEWQWVELMLEKSARQ